MARANQLHKQKLQSIIALRTEGQSVWKIAKTLNVSPSEVAKTIKHYDETGSHEDCPRKGRPRVTSAAEEKFIWVTSLRNCKLTAPQIRAQMNSTQSSSSRHISTSTVQRLHESGLYGQIAAESNKQNSFVWAMKNKEWTLDQWKSVLWSDEIFGTQKRWMDGLYMHGSHHEA